MIKDRGEDLFFRRMQIQREFFPFLELSRDLQEPMGAEEAPCLEGRIPNKRSSYKGICVIY